MIRLVLKVGKFASLSCVPIEVIFYCEKNKKLGRLIWNVNDNPTCISCLYFEVSFQYDKLYMYFIDVFFIVYVTITFVWIWNMLKIISVLNTIVMYEPIQKLMILRLVAYTFLWIKKMWITNNLVRHILCPSQNDITYGQE